jgi:hypothetical protein
MDKHLDYSLYFLQFLTDSGNLRLCYIFIPKLYIVGLLSKLTDIVLLLKIGVEYKIPTQMDKHLDASCAFQRILNCQSSHIWTYLIWELWFYVTEMRKNKTKVCFVESSFGQKVRSTFLYKYLTGTGYHKQSLVQRFQSEPVPGTFTRLRSCIVQAEITEPPKNNL